MSRSLPLEKKEAAGAVQSIIGHRANLPRFLCLISIILVVCAISPVMAGTQIMTGSPELNAHIVGTNEFSPGDDVNLQITIENTGLNQFEIVETGLITPTDLSNTAKQVTATLDAGDAPLVVKADPQIVGDLLASDSAIATFHITVNQYAPGGTYQIPIILNYSYLYQANQEGSETLNYQYKNVNETLSIPITIKPEVEVAVSNVETEGLNAGNEGYIYLTVKNIGSDNGQNAVIRIQQNGQSPIVPTDGSFYVGDYPVGSAVNCTFRAQISSNAQQSIYPLDVLVYYKNFEGDYVDSPIETVGVQVGQKVDFAITPVSASVTPGANAVITFQFQNTGGTTAYNAEARISAIDPFTSNDDTAFLGTMAPGDVRTASFNVAVDPSATVKEYGLDSEVIYRDALDNQFTSDPLKANVEVVPAKSVVSLIGLPYLVAILIVVLAIAGYVVYVKRFKPR
ncbi:COG1361 S-layer family protein [Methanoregula sp.]|uniref:COG1361 S-layer family protein n=1 Tax=Methanoregula sp. TaxID=2052170 RepID=UPI003BB0576D